MKLQRRVENFIKKHDLEAGVLKIAAATGYDPLHWMRVVPYKECSRLLEKLDLKECDALEISAGSVWQKKPFRSFTEMNYPDFDICFDKMDSEFDVVIADNVFEHLEYPSRAAKNVFSMIRPGGYFLNITPFLVRIHEIPNDCTRWTEYGMVRFLEEAGFDSRHMHTGSWGNEACVKANLTRWRRRGWTGSLQNDPRFPCQVWVFAQKSMEG